MAREIGRITRHDIAMSIERTPVVVRASEAWEIRIVHDLPFCRVWLRPGARGTWLGTPAGIPRDVMQAFDLRERRDGGLETLRGWKSWSRLRWKRFQGRRLRARQGEIVAKVIIDGVARPTGAQVETLVFDPVGAPDPSALSPLRVRLPQPAWCIAAQGAMLRRAITWQTMCTRAHDAPDDLVPV